jgi:hypothetical protein
MAEYKTYTCDKCHKPDAIRLKFAVDYEDDPADGKRFTIPGFADACPAHMADFFQEAISHMTMEEQRKLWKRMLSKLP